MSYDTERARARRRLIALGAGLLGLVAGAVVAVLLLSGGGGPGATAALDDFLSRYQARDYAGAAAVTDGKPKQVAAALEANVDGLDGAKLESAEVTSIAEDGDKATATVAYAWQVPDIGRFAYEDPKIELARTGDEWLVRWRDDVVHPALDDGMRLGTTREFHDRAPILDRNGSALVVPRAVVEIGVIPAKLDDVGAAVAAIDRLTEADAKTLRRSIEAAPSPENFVPAITLREEDFQRVHDELDAIRGVEFGPRELPLAPTKEFARALLGSVGPITAEQLKKLGGPYAVGDNVGQFGLEAAYERRLAGTPDRAVITRLADGTPEDALLKRDGHRGKPLRTTLDLSVQDAAEQALGSSDDVTALVAIEPSSGDVLAAATRPVDDSYDRGFEAEYPPGSTFKVITTTALLAAGLDPDETVDCPPTIVAGGRSFRNFEGGAAGAVPFRTDFAESCNTAFVSLADRLGFGDLHDTALSFGVGRDYHLGVPTFPGKVPVSKDATEQAAAMIGQARILVSPVAMAGVAATVIAGRWHQPRVLASDPHKMGGPLPAGDLAVLRSLMRDVVTEGTGTALAGVAGAPIGKSGTAEYGSGDPPPTHAWFIAGRRDIAVAVLVEDKPSGGQYAAPIVARFLDALGP